MHLILVVNSPDNGRTTELKARLEAVLEGVDVEVVDFNNAGIEIGAAVAPENDPETDLLDFILRSTADPRSDIVMRALVDEPSVNLPQLQRHALNDFDFGHISGFSMRAYRATLGQAKRQSKLARR